MAFPSFPFAGSFPEEFLNYESRDNHKYGVGIRTRKGFSPMNSTDSQEQAVACFVEIRKYESQTGLGFGGELTIVQKDRKTPWKGSICTMLRGLMDQAEKEIIEAA